MTPPAALLRQLSALAWTFGPEAAERRRWLFDELGARSLPAPTAVRQLHDALCLARAYPDDKRVLAVAEQQLATFGSRADVRRFRRVLRNSGIAGTDIVYAFGAPTARWLAARWPDRLSIEWNAVPDEARLTRHLLLLAIAAEVPGFDEPPVERPRDWARRLARGSTDAAFVIGGSAALCADEAVRDRLFEELDLPIRLRAGLETPSRTRAAWRGAGPPVYQAAPLRLGRPDLAREVRRPPRAIREVTRAEARALVDLARGAMVTRERDLDAFAGADDGDVRLVNAGDGLQFACLGVVPAKRFLLESVYGFLTLKNGVPIGYALASALFRSSEIAYNVFDTFRGGEAAWIYARLLATVRALFGSDTFSIYPYQLGHENDEGLHSGAWWFYYKLGFRPRDERLRPLVAREAARVAANPRYRTPERTLRRLVARHLFFSIGRPRADAIGAWPAGRVGLAVTRYVADRFGTDRERATAVCADEAARLVGLAGWRRLPAGERLMWERWAPLLLTLGEIARWPADDRRALAAVVRAKGGGRESNAIPLLDGHRRLRRALGRVVLNPES